VQINVREKQARGSITNEKSKGLFDYFEDMENPKSGEDSS